MLLKQTELHSHILTSQSSNVEGKVRKLKENEALEALHAHFEVSFWKAKEKASTKSAVSATGTLWLTLSSWPTALILLGLTKKLSVLPDFVAISNSFDPVRAGDLSVMSYGCDFLLWLGISPWTNVRLSCGVCRLFPPYVPHEMVCFELAAVLS